MKFPALFDNKYFGYAVIVLGAVHVLGYMGEKAWECLVFFGLTVLAVERKFKNRSVAILAGIFLANMIFGCGRTIGVSEGFIGNYFKNSSDHIREGMTSMDKAAKKAGKEAMLAKKCADGSDPVDGKCADAAAAKAKVTKDAAKMTKEVGAAVNNTDNQIKADKKKKKKAKKKEINKKLETDVKTQQGKTMDIMKKAAASLGSLTDEDDTSTDAKKADAGSDKKVDAPATPAVPTTSTDTPTGTEGFGLMSGGHGDDIFAGGNSPYQEGFSNGSDLYNDFMNYAQENGELFSGLGDKLVQEGFVSMNDYAAMDFRMQRYGQHNPNNVGY